MTTTPTADAVLAESDRSVTLARVEPDAGMLAAIRDQLTREIGESYVDEIGGLLDPETRALVARWLTSAQFARNTQKAYAEEITRWARWTIARLGVRPAPLLSLTPRLLEEWAAWMRSQGKAVRTQRRALSALSSLFKFAQEDGVDVRNPVIFKRHAEVLGRSSNGRPVGAARAVTPEEVDRMRKACSDDRDRLVLALLYTNALRVSEVAGARIEHLDRDSTPCVLYVQRKGETWHKVPLSTATCELLDSVIGDRIEGPILPGEVDDDGVVQPVTRYGLTRITQRLARRGGVANPRGVTPHTLRAGAITAQLNNGTPIAEVQKWAGHARSDTTIGYWERTNAVARDLALVNRLEAILDETAAGLRTS